MYKELFELLKREKETIELQRLPKDIYAKIASYIKKMNQENRMLDKKTTKAKLLANELQHSKIIVSELLHCRYEKFLRRTLAEETVARDTITDEEKKLYEEVLPLPEAFKSFSKDILRGHLSKVEKDEKQAMTVLRFIEEIPALIGSDLNAYGPFAPEDIATLPTENARIFVRQGLAIEVDSS